MVISICTYGFVRKTPCYAKKQCVILCKSSYCLSDTSVSFNCYGCLPDTGVPKVAAMPGRDTRRLPAIPTKGRQRSSSQTLRFAVTWLQKNKDTLDTALAMLEAHPNLIHQECCGKINQFVTNFALRNTLKVYKDDTDALMSQQRGQTHKNFSPSSSTECSNSKVPKLEVPEIYVSQPEDDENSSFPGTRPESRGIHKVCICGDVDSEKWYRLIVNLSCQFLVHCVAAESETRRRSNASEDIHDVATFVFLLDNKSFHSHVCRRALRNAVDSNVSVVFVRDMEFNMDLHYEHTHRHSYNSYTHGPKDKTRSVPNMPLLSRDSTLSDLSVPKNREIHKLGGRVGSPGPKPRHDSPVPTFASDTFLHADVEYDLDRFIHEGYGVALTYHALYHGACLHRIENVVADRCHGFLSSHNHGNLPFSTYTSSDSAFSDTYSSPTPEPPREMTSPTLELDVRRTGRKSVDANSMDSIDSSASETLFLVSRPLEIVNPVVIRYPHETVQGDISSSPSIDSFGFQDIDLSKRVNEIDWFEELS